VDRYCSNCGQELRDEDRFCPSCGSAVHETAHVPTPQGFDQVWEIIKEIGVYERHFSQLQHQYRVLASTWILAVFAATGFVLANERLALDVPKELAIVGLTIFAGTGITLLWVLDLRVHGMLLAACFNVGLELEDKYPWSLPNRPWLPPVRGMMLTSQRGVGSATYVAMFYVAATAVVLTLGDLFLWMWFYREGGVYRLCLAIVLTLVFVAWCFYLHRAPMINRQRRRVLTMPTSSRG
jgi:zinc ribbon protein